MPVLAVKSLGVNAAMSFICGLATMATLMEPPFPPVAGGTLAAEVELELFSPPPHPAAIALTTASSAAADQRRTVPLMSSPPASTRRSGFLRNRFDLYRLC